MFPTGSLTKKFENLIDIGWWGGGGGGGYDGVVGGGGSVFIGM